MWPDKPAGAQPLRLRDASAGLLGAALRDQQIAAHICQRYVVLRVERPLPHVQGMGSIKHLLAAREPPDTTRYRLDMVDHRDHRRIVVHCPTPFMPKGRLGNGSAAGRAIPSS
jgi:hypothetical protein